MKARQRESVAFESPEAEHASEKASATSLDAWSSFVKDIQKQCLKRNFGTLSKSEFDLLVFHYYLLNKQVNVGGQYVSDYDIGLELGLTIQRVRSLREREALKWPPKNDWKDRFLECLKHARCDEMRNVKLLVPDVNVIKGIRNFIEKAGLIDDYQLNPKVFQCNLDALIAICLDFKSGSDGNLCGRILDKLRENKDGKVAHAVKEREQPIRTAIQKAVVKSVQGGIELIPGVGKACGELFAKLFEN